MMNKQKKIKIAVSLIILLGIIVFFYIGRCFYQEPRQAQKREIERLTKIAENNPEIASKLQLWKEGKIDLSQDEIEELLRLFDRNSITQNSDYVTNLLQGKWLNDNKDWGLIFKDNKVSEYEDGIQAEGEYILDLNSNPIKMTITEDQKPNIIFLIEFNNSQTLVLDNGEERIILIKE